MARISRSEAVDTRDAGERTGPRQVEPESEAMNDATDHAIVFFDGVCGLCNGFVDFLLARDSRRLFLFAPLQGETAGRLIHDEHHRPGERNRPSRLLDSVVLLEEGIEYRNSTAVVRILHRLGGGWRIVSGLLWVIPRPIRDAGYRLVAVSRYRLFGKKETCRLPTAAERERFLP